MAKRYVVLVAIYAVSMGVVGASVNYVDFFKSNTLRVDFTLAGDFNSEQAFLEKLVLEPYWGGRKVRLDVFHGLGNYKFELTDNLTGTLIYTDGFCTLFEEWQTTQEAYKVQRAFYNSIVMPYPFRNSTLKVMKRVRGTFSDTILILPIEPAGEAISVATFPKFRTKSIKNTADPEHVIDIVLLAEGYRENEMNDFFSDAKAFATHLNSSAVFSKNSDRLNIRAIASVSLSSGCDDPKKNEWAETILNSSFNTIGINRYLMTRDINTVRNIAGMVPYDQIYILVNTDKYGGGGIFNFINIAAARARNNREVILHELGHGFGGLGDEYVNSGSANKADLSVEPWENNLTLFSGSDIKWQNLIEPGTPLPTPYNVTDGTDKVGLFEGGANASEGIYRPAFDCRMRSNEAEDFCPVCQQNIQMLFDFYTTNQD